MEYAELSNGVKMPMVGYGVYQVTKDECDRCVLDALRAGYRSIDTAQSYFNEEEVGNAIEKSGVPRDDIFLTTKVWIEHYGYEKTKASVPIGTSVSATPSSSAACICAADGRAVKKRSTSPATSASKPRIVLWYCMTLSRAKFSP